MPRKKTISDEALLAAAREVFSKQGYQVPVSAIAAHAGVSSATVFLRFPTKEELLFAVVSSAFAEHLLPLLPTLAAEESPREALVRLARAQLHLFRTFAPAMLIGASAGSRLFLQCLPEENAMSQTHHAISGFFAREMAARRFREGDPMVTARVFSSIFAHYAFMEALGASLPFKVDEETYVRSAVELVCNGLLVSSSPLASPPVP